MKKNYFLFIIFIVAINVNFFKAQQYIKMPFDNNHVWREYCSYWQTTNGNNFVYYNNTYYIKFIKDSTINNKVYKYFLTYAGTCNSGLSIPKFLRDDTIQRKVVMLNGNNQEVTLYNFNKNIGDTALLDCGTATVTAKDSVLLGDGKYHKRFTYSSNYCGGIDIEGIGSSRGLLTAHSQMISGNTVLQCMGKLNPYNIIYNSNQQNNCSLIVGINSNSIINPNISFYPNPVTNNITINFTSNYKNQKISSLIVSNNIGQIVMQEDLILDKETINIDLKNLPNGIYFFKLKSEAFEVNKKVVVSK